jgi:hypothetical protein
VHGQFSSGAALKNPWKKLLGVSTSSRKQIMRMHQQSASRSALGAVRIGAVASTASYTDFIQVRSIQGLEKYKPSSFHKRKNSSSIEEKKGLRDRVG